jgi:hypothetical protein
MMAVLIVLYGNEEFVKTNKNIINISAPKMGILKTKGR